MKNLLTFSLICILYGTLSVANSQNSEVNLFEKSRSVDKPMNRAWFNLAFSGSRVPYKDLGFTLGYYFVGFETKILESPGLGAGAGWETRFSRRLSLEAGIGIHAYLPKMQIHYKFCAPVSSIPCGEYQYGHYRMLALQWEMPVRFRFRITPYSKFNVIIGARFQTTVLNRYSVDEEDFPGSIANNIEVGYDPKPLRNIDFMPGIEYQPVIASRVMRISLTAGANVINPRRDHFDNHFNVRLGLGTVIGKSN